MSNSAHLLVAATHLRPGFATFLHSPRAEGWAERRQAHLIVVVAPVRARVSRACEARRVRCARRATHARLSALHRGFPLPLIPERKEAYATPRSAFRMSPETPLDEQGWQSR